ncbi:O-antigen translocase [Elizabethkingia ursingii]|uniref:Multidrug transporter MatE n=1 Tax=Elizabethkingia ursingii TaxID=1756150 RepID=A0ABX3N689_9FLAO|nr:O-antigen translocase [Elizabethkingia ursingii]OPB86954.1 multidrug transporter MatE [Elizabethkingia ursingii]
MKLIKTTLFSGLITFIRLASGFVSTKVVAMLIGAPGVAVVGAFANFISIILAFANGAINNGIVKYSSEYKPDEQKSKELFSTSFKISFFCSVLTGIVLIIFASFFSVLIFSTNIYSEIIIVLGLSIVLYSLNTMLISILNGRGLIEIYTLVNTIGSIVGLILTILLVYYFKVKGALYAMIFAQTVIFLFTAIIVLRKTEINFSWFRLKFNKDIAKGLYKYSFMAITSALTVPVSQILVRNTIIHFEGLEKAGLWQGMMRVSDAYLLVITTALATYYLPKISSILNIKELRAEIRTGYKYIFPATLIITIVIFFAKDIIIQILYTNSFYSMRELFLWQLLGDFFKIMAFILAYVMLAKAQMKIYIGSEIFFSALYVVLSFILVKQIGAIGATIAFAVNYFIYMIFLFIYYNNLIFYKK